MTTAEKIYSNAHATPAEQELHEMELFFESHPDFEALIKQIIDLPKDKRMAAIHLLLGEAAKCKADQ